MSKDKDNPVLSLYRLMKVLDTEGFTEYSASLVERYERRKAKDLPRRWAAFEKNKKRLALIMKDIDPADKLVIGKFFAAKESMAFEAGIRMGLTARSFLSLEDSKGAKSQIKTPE